jgi:hypothetical protein
MNPMAALLESNINISQEAGSKVSYDLPHNFQLSGNKNCLLFETMQVFWSERIRKFI